MIDSIDASKVSGVSRSRWIVGWIAVLLNIGTSCLWAFWGGIESFHEGWWHETLAENVSWTFAYLAPAGVFTAIGVLGLIWPRIGALVIFGFTVWFWWWWDVIGRFQQSNIGGAIIGIFMTGMSGLFVGMWWYGRAQPLRLALLGTVLAPLIVAVFSAAYPAYLVATRTNDGNFGARVVSGKGVELEWAPQGSGWPVKGGANWFEARDIASRLSLDGKSLLNEPQNFWRLPTNDEYVRSCVRHGVNSGGQLVEPGKAIYVVRPDKETPLWNPKSEVIYWWTADEPDDRFAWSVVYNGLVVRRQKKDRMETLGFRAVRSATQ